MTTLDANPISFRIKPSAMDERKRSANYDNDDISPPLKRQATGANGTIKTRDPEADGIGRDPDLEVCGDTGGTRFAPPFDLSYRTMAHTSQEFQREAALRQMNEYKRAKKTVEKELEDLQKKSAAHDDHIRAADAWFSQVGHKLHHFCKCADPMCSTVIT